MPLYELGGAGAFLPLAGGVMTAGAVIDTADAASPGALTVGTGTATADNPGGTFSVLTGSGFTDGNGGDLIITLGSAGSGIGRGGDVTITAGNGGGTSNAAADGGDISLISGSAGIDGLATGGDILLRAKSTGAPASGSITLQTDSVTGAGNVGNILFSLGNATTGIGGGFTATLGNSAGANAGGAWAVTGGQGGPTGIGGAITLTGGQGGTNGAGGAASLIGGAGGSVSGTSGAVLIESPAPVGGGTRGGITLNGQTLTQNIYHTSSPAWLVNFNFNYTAGEFIRWQDNNSASSDFFWVSAHSGTDFGFIFGTKGTQHTEIRNSATTSTWEVLSTNDLVIQTDTNSTSAGGAINVIGGTRNSGTAAGGLVAVTGGAGNAGGAGGAASLVGGAGGDTGAGGAVAVAAGAGGGTAGNSGAMTLSSPAPAGSGTRGAFTSDFLTHALTSYTPTSAFVFNISPDMVGSEDFFIVQDNTVATPQLRLKLKDVSGTSTLAELYTGSAGGLGLYTFGGGQRGDFSFASNTLTVAATLATSPLSVTTANNGAGASGGITLQTGTATTTRGGVLMDANAYTLKSSVALGANAFSLDVGPAGDSSSNLFLVRGNVDATPQNRFVVQAVTTANTYAFIYGNTGRLTFLSAAGGSQGQIQASSSSLIASALGNGSLVRIIASAGLTTSVGGNAEVTAGQGGPTNATGGQAVVTAGAGGGTTGAGGQASLVGGAGGTGAATGGATIVRAGTGGATSGNSGNVTIDSPTPVSGTRGTLSTSFLSSTDTRSSADGNTGYTLNFTTTYTSATNPMYLITDGSGSVFEIRNGAASGSWDFNFFKSNVSRVRLRTATGATSIEDLVANSSFTLKTASSSTGVGALRHVAGNATAGNNAGGLIELIAGTGNGTSAGGAITATSGTGGATNATGGVFTATAGAGGGTTGQGGLASLIGGAGASSGVGGGIAITAGAGGGTAGNSGSITISSPTPGGSGRAGTIALNAHNLTMTTAEAAATAAALEIKNTDSGTTGVLLTFFHDGTSQANGDVTGRINFDGESSTGVRRLYGSYGQRIASTANTTEIGSHVWWTINGGAENECMRLSGPGVLSVDLAGSGTAAQVDLFDDYDDVELIRSLYRPQGPQETEEALRQYEEIGLTERKFDGDGWMLRLQPAIALGFGAHVQTNARVLALENENSELRARLTALEAKLRE